MDPISIRFLFDYDAWATRRVLEAAQGLEGDDWAGAPEVGERNLADILTHVLGANMRWRHAWQGLPGDGPRPERGPRLSPAELRAAFELEWPLLHAWLASLNEEDLARTTDVPLWQELLHVANHGTQHRSEAAALLTELGRSPGDLDLIDFAEERAKVG